MTGHPHSSPRVRAARQQRGVVMLFGLIALAIMLIGAAAMVRSISTSMLNAGNLGFKRDLTNQGERAVTSVMTLLQTGALNSETARQSSDAAQNYSATMLVSNAQGLPNALVSDSTFSGIGTGSNDITIADQAVTVRYLVDRLCVNTGVATATHCSMADDPNPPGGSGSESIRAEDSSAGGAGAVGQRVVYRVSIRVTGPRSTQAFFQTTLSL
jgi:type IV pilus assembly protein PilX